MPVTATAVEPIVKLPEKFAETVPAMFVIVAVAEESEIELDSVSEEAVPVTVQLLASV